MGLTPRLMFTALLLGTVCASALGVLLEEAGRGAQLGVAIGAIAALVLSWAWVMYTCLRLVRQDEPESVERARQRIVRVHLPVMLAFPFLLIAAHPWGIATVAYGGGAYIACHFLYVHVLLAIGLIHHRRQRRAAAS